MHTFLDSLPREMMLLEKYAEVNFDVECLMVNPVTKQWIFFLPDIPLLTKKYCYFS
jgi:hypothetical protein